MTFIIKMMHIIHSCWIHLFKRIIILTLLSATATMPLSTLASSWIGRTSSQLISSWGTPNTSILLRNQQKILIYERITTTAPSDSYSSPVGVNVSNPARPVIVMPMNTLNNFNRGATPLSLKCTYRFMVNARGIIINEDSIGNGC